MNWLLLSFFRLMLAMGAVLTFMAGASKASRREEPQGPQQREDVGA
jgi:hypothetical protein